ncbi:hypothetical protein SCHPADRAFT_742352 [Schizopora paradoxa]|uniref:Uncharacterized protein n=1 Tax=Schizopora paradoxa TaxID=27342 RepID=A0A0H2R651_9AGAM|nr:hypothetical protein SCHPADRAFT_742352 [Schizopora paradoxa]
MNLQCVKLCSPLASSSLLIASKMKKRRRRSSPSRSKGIHEGTDEQEPLSVSHLAAGITGEEVTSETMHITSPSSDNVITVNEFLNWSAENGGLHLKRTYKNRNGRTRYNRVILSSDADTPLLGNGESKSTRTSNCRKLFLLLRCILILQKNAIGFVVYSDSDAPRLDLQPPPLAARLHVPPLDDGEERWETW